MLPITITVVDSKGLSDQYTFNVRVSEEVDFVANIKVSNVLGHNHNLQFGTSMIATTGDGTDGHYTGKLDSNLCEIEIPPVPGLDVFDTR